jgi:ectoine hydroxylase-related dioxygenase (phytanoyl-CoA dioxygenase family)
MMNGEMNLDQMHHDYDRDGVIMVRDFLNQNQLSTLMASLDYAVTNPGPMASDLVASDSGNFFFDFLTFRRNPHIKSLCFDLELLHKLSKIVGTNEIRMFHDNVLIKSGDAPATRWHQDRPHYLVDGPKNFSVWMSPDDVSENESLAFIPESHKCGKIFHSRSFKDGEEISENNNFVSLTSEDFDLLTAKGIRVYHVRPGDAIVFDNRMLHSALRGREPANRRALSLRFIGDGAHLTTNFADPTPPLHRMGMKMIDGGTPNEIWFPIVFNNQ